MSDCPSTVELDLAAALAASGGNLPEIVAAHVAGCTKCAELLDEMKRNAAIGDEVGRLTPAARRRGDDAVEDRVPGYHIIRELHRGGQGVVYEADQQGSGRRVAVKMLLQGGFATTRQRLRFEQEIRIAANLRHPGLVTVFEPISTPDGRLGYAMELIEGERLDEWAARIRADGLTTASLARILNTFAHVCDAVSYAHGRAVIHRDLKPANVLVDDGDQPRVLDFGIAKALDTGGTDVQSTRTGEFIGTLAYAAPEQVSRDPGLIDVRTDVYALGLILHEMLTGRPARRMEAPVAAIVEQILTEDLAPPSAIARRIDDDVDTIVVKAAAREPERRYRTAEALRDDVTAYLAGRPIAAKRDSRAYVLRKTIRRHRVPITIAAIILLLLAGFVVQLVASNLELRRKTDLSHAGILLRGELDEIAKIADREFATAEAKQAQITVVLPRLDAIAGDIEETFRTEPLLEAGLHASVGEIYRQMARFEQAQRHIELALEKRRQILGTANVETLRSMKDLAELYRELGEMQGGERTEASRELLEEALAVSRGIHGADGEITLSIMANLGRVCLDARETERAAGLYAEALEALRRNGRGDSVDALRCETGLALVEHERAKALRRSDNEEQRQAGAAADARARTALEAALARQTRLLGTTHLLTQKTMNNLAIAYVLSDDPELLGNAETLWAGLLSARERTLGRNHKRTLTTQANLGELYVDMDDPHSALALLPGARDGLEKLFGPDDLIVVNLTSRLGEVYRRLERYDEAEAAYLQAIRGMRRNVSSPDDPNAWILGRFLTGYARLLIETHRAGDALPALEEAVTMLRQRVGEDHRFMIEVRELFAAAASE